MITAEQKDVFNTYAQIKRDIKILEAKAEELNPHILEVMQEEEVEELTLSNLGKLCIGSRRNWKYSPEIKKKDEELKAIKKHAEQTGIGAEYTEKKYVIFKGLKEESDVE